MSDIRDDSADGGNAPDPIAQLKGETSRKLDNVNAQLEKLAQANALLIEKLTAVAPAKKAAPEQEEDLSTLAYTDPAKYAAVIEERTTAKITAQLTKREEAQARTNAVMNELTNEYPEITDAKSDLSKKALEIYNSIPEHERNTTAAFKLAVKEAAMEIGVKPKSKRSDDENFMGPSGGVPTSRSRRQATKLSPETEQWAALLGVDLSDKEVHDRVVQRAQRDFRRYQQPLTTKKGKK